MVWWEASLLLYLNLNPSSFYVSCGELFRDYEDVHVAAGYAVSCYGAAENVDFGVWQQFSGCFCYGWSGFSSAFKKPGPRPQRVHERHPLTAFVTSFMISSESLRASSASSFV